MKQRRSIKSIIPVLAGAILLAVVLVAGCRPKPAGTSRVEKGYYTCPMHTQLRLDKPGNCPICGMKLVWVTMSHAGDPELALDSSLRYLTEPVTGTVVGTFRVMTPVQAGIPDTIRSDGYIGFDQRDVNTVSARVSGRIEKLFVKYSGQPIRKGQPLMTIYSPPLLSAQRDLLQSVKDKDTVLVKALREKLANLGMYRTEIESVIRRREPLTTITLYSPYSGISQPGGSSSAGINSPAAGMGGSDMNSSASMTAGSSATVKEAPQGLAIREGMYVNQGQTMVTIQDLRKKWAILNLFTEDLWRVRPGDPVVLYADADPSGMLTGRVDFVPPYRASDEKTTRIRVYLDHLPENWKIGTLIHGRITRKGSDSGSAVPLPLSAVNRLGMRSVVWVQDTDHPHVFHAREVKTGRQAGDSILVLSGIRPGDKIVENAAYMVDSDSFIE